MARKDIEQYTYNDWFNKYFEVHDNWGVFAGNKKKLDDDKWKSAHEYAKKQLKRYASKISGEDRQRLNVDDRAAHEIYDAMDPKSNFNTASLFGNGDSASVGNLGLGIDGPKDDSPGDDRNRRQNNSSQPNQEETPEQEPEEAGDPDDGLTQTDDTGDKLEQESLNNDEPDEEPEDKDPGSESESPEGKNNSPQKGSTPNETKGKELGDAAKDAGNAAKNLSETGAKLGEAAEGAVAAAEGVAAAAETVEVAAGAGALIVEGWPVLLAIVVVLILAAIIFFLLQTIAAANPAADVEKAATVCADTSSLGSPNSGGYYQLPSSTNYTLNYNGGTPRSSQWGNKDTIELIMNVGKTWSASHSDQQFSVGDINSSGHDSHKSGVDIDIYNNHNKLFMSNPGHSSNPNYSKELTIELGKAFIDTDAIDMIGYSDQKVIDELNEYIKSSKKSGSVRNWSGHDDHFHIRVKPGKYKCEEASSTTPGGSTTNTGMPVDTGKGFHITSPFGRRSSPCSGCSSFHQGVDISISGSADAGLPVYSVADGEVAEVSQKTSGCGLRIIGIKHSGIIAKTRYVHLSPVKGKELVKKGDKVKAGQQIGNLETTADLGHDSCSTGIHLHFETYKSFSGSPVDPEKMIKFKF